MLIARIPNATRVLGKQQGYSGLPLRDEVRNTTVDGPTTPVMVTAWEPTPDELEVLFGKVKSGRYSSLAMTSLENIMWIVKELTS